MQNLMALLLGVMVAMMEGCALLSSPAWVPVVEPASLGSGRFIGEDKRVGTLATVAQRRLALVKFGDGKFCAEPPPDVADSVSATLSAALSGGNGKINAAGEMVHDFATAAKQLLYRSQGLQLYRDGMFSLCVAYLNKAISEEEFKHSHKELLTIAGDLIKTELPLLKDIKADTTVLPAVSDASKPK
jgi:hypothetical protein